MRTQVILVVCILLARTCQAGIITGGDYGPGDFNSIQAAMNCANDGDTVAVQLGTYLGRGNHIIYSDDYGKSGQSGGIVRAGKIDEAQVVELTGGSIMMNMRSHGGRGCRAVSMRNDGGITWAVGRQLHEESSAYSYLAVLPDGDIACLYEAGERSPYESIAFKPVSLERVMDPNGRVETERYRDGGQAGDLSRSAGATLGIQANRRIAVRTFGKKSRAYINRKRLHFTGVPDFLQGLQYTVQVYKKIVILSCRAESLGRIYLCVFGDKSPERIERRCEWKKCGTMRGPEFGGKKEWTIYEADVQAGQILTFTPDDIMGIVVAAKEITKDKSRPLPQIPAVINGKRYTGGKSVEGRPIEYLVFGEGKDVVFMLAAIHGDEQVGIPLVHQLAQYLDEHAEVLDGRKVVLLPNANPDGVARFAHGNANGVDLNRNFDSKNRRNSKIAGRHALSQPEARVIHEIIKKYSPGRIVSIHQLRGWSVYTKKPPGIVDWEGPGEALAKRMSGCCKLPVVRFGTQRGSLGAYAGDDLGIPIVTFELPKFDYGLSSGQLWEKYGTALIKAVTYPENVNEDMGKKA